MVQPGEEFAMKAIEGALSSAEAALSPSTAAPAPAQAPAASEAPAASTPAEAAAPSPAGSPAGQQPPAAPAEGLEKRFEDSQAFIKTLQEERRADAERIQNLLSEQGNRHNELLTALREQTAALKPQLTPEQREAEVQSNLLSFNQDPSAWVERQSQAKIQPLLKRIEELEGKTGRLAESVEPLTPRLVYQQQIERLSQTMPEVREEAFQKAMQDKAITDKVYAAHFKGKSAEDVFKDPLFYSLVAYETKLSAKAAFTPQLTQAEKDKAAQDAIGRQQGGVGRVPGGPAGAAPAKAKPLAEQVADEIVNAKPTSFHDALEAAFKK